MTGAKTKKSPGFAKNGAGGSFDDLEKLFDGADEKMSARKYLDAADIYNRIIVSSDNVFDSSDYGLLNVYKMRAGIFRAQCYDSSANADLAVDAYDYLADNFDSPQIQNLAQFRQGMILYESGRFKKAIPFFKRQKKVAKVHKNKESGLFYLGRCYEEIGKKSTAVKVYKELIEKYPYQEYSLKARLRLESL